MATTLPVGSGQTYTTPEGAIAAIPSVLLDDYIILLKDIAEYVYTANSVNHLSFTGYTNTTFTISMYPDTGKAFKDNFVYGTDAIKYNSAKGVCLRSTGTYSFIVVIAQDRVITRDLMIKSDHASAVTYDSSSASSTNCEHTRLILDDNLSTSAKPFNIYGNGTTVQNILNFRRNTGTGGMAFGSGGSPSTLARFVTTIRDSGKTAGGTGFTRVYNAQLNNCIEFGYTTAATAFDAGSGNNASDLAPSGLPGSNNVYNITNACWTGITAATLNLTVASGCALAGAGTNIAAVTTDILGAARPNPPAIGALEPFTGGGGGFTPKLRKTLSGLGTRVGSRQVHGW